MKMRNGSAAGVHGMSAEFLKTRRTHRRSMEDNHRSIDDEQGTAGMKYDCPNNYSLSWSP
jgi:hypothetical protein